MPHRDLRCALELDDVDPETFRVTSFAVEERLSELFRLTLEAVAQEELDLSVRLGKKVSLVLFKADEPVRRWHGQVVRLEGEHLAAGGYRLQIEMAPHMECLRLGRNTRMFQDKSAKDIIESIWKEAGLPSGGKEWMLKETPPTRPYTVQAGESDLDFVQRLLSEEGIGYAVKMGESEEKIIFFDDSSQLAAIDGTQTLTDRLATHFDEDVLDKFREIRAESSDAVMSRDYDFTKPAFDASNKEEAPKSTQREVYVHPAPFAGTGTGKTRAKRMLESLRVQVHSVQGESDCPRLEAGRIFTAQGSLRGSLNAEYCLVSVSHWAELGEGVEGESVLGYRNALLAIPKETPFRPPQLAEPMPLLEVAYVTCPPGEELHSDNWGRVKVRFPWDRSGASDDKSSTWLRVGQPPMPGSMVLPRGTFEVAVDFERGQVDLPFVSGHIYNAEAAPPYALPGGKTRTSFQTATTQGGGGANELRFEDAAGEEEIFLNASKDHTLSVDNDASLQVTQHQKTKIGSNAKLKIGKTMDLEVVGHRKLEVGAGQETNVGEDFSESIQGSEKLTVGGVKKEQVGGDLAESVKGTFERTIGGLMAVTAIRGYGRTIKGKSDTKVGAAWLELVGRNRMSTVGGLRTETIGALKMVKAKQISISCGAAYAATAASEADTVKGGWTDTAKGAVALTAGGGMSLKAKTVTFEGKNSLSVNAGGCSFKLSKSGTVEITAPTVDLKGVEALTQISHKSN